MSLIKFHTNLSASPKTEPTRNESVTSTSARSFPERKSGSISTARFFILTSACSEASAECFADPDA